MLNAKQKMVGDMELNLKFSTTAERDEALEKLSSVWGAQVLGGIGETNISVSASYDAFYMGDELDRIGLYPDEVSSFSNDLKPSRIIDAVKEPITAETDGDFVETKPRMFREKRDGFEGHWPR